MALKIGAPLPSLDGIQEWIGGAVSNSELHGHPVLFDFWALSCPYCISYLHKLNDWRDRYAEQGLRIVAVHLPRDESDHDIPRIRAVLQEQSIEAACALDPEGLLASRFETGEVWPYYFLFDSRGTMRSRAAGYTGLQLLEKALERSLALTPSP